VADIRIRTTRGTTRIQVGSGALTGLERAVGARRPFVLLDRNVDLLHGERIRGAVERPIGGTRRLPPGEPAKRLDVAAKIWSWLARCGARRDDVIVAAGGGATLDLAGFVASTWMRGIAWIAVPTTLVAQADACAGGKTAIDLPAGKNLIGTFHPPDAAFADPSLLLTVPERDHRAARFELLKCAWLGARGLRSLVLGADLARRRPEALSAAVAASLRLKRRLVEADLMDRGERRLLNLGHTFGHALEVAGRFRRLRHGEAVGIGLVAAAAVARRAGLLSASGWRRACAEVLALEPPTPSPAMVAAATAAVVTDKKRDRHGIVLILPTDGGAIVRAGFETSEFRRGLEIGARVVAERSAGVL